MYSKNPYKRTVMLRALRLKFLFMCHLNIRGSFKQPSPTWNSRFLYTGFYCMCSMSLWCHIYCDYSVTSICPFIHLLQHIPLLAQQLPHRQIDIDHEICLPLVWINQLSSAQFLSYFKCCFSYLNFTSSSWLITTPFHVQGNVKVNTLNY